MTQRNPMNQRNTSDKHTGSSRKSSASAKPKAKAAASVHQPSAKATRKQQEQKDKDKQREERVAAQKRAAVLSAQTKQLDEYKKWRRIWWIVIVVAIVAVVASWVFSWLGREGRLPEVLVPATTPVSIGGLVIGYAAIIAALVIDFKKIRKFRREQEAKAAKMSNSQRRKLDAAIAEQEERERAEREEKRNKKKRRRADKDAEADGDEKGEKDGDEKGEKDGDEKGEKDAAEEKGIDADAGGQSEKRGAHSRKSASGVHSKGAVKTTGAHSKPSRDTKADAAKKD